LVGSDDFDVKRFLPLLNAIRRIEPDEVIWEKVYTTVTESTPPPPDRYHSTLNKPHICAIQAASEFWKYVDDVLKEELGSLHIQLIIQAAGKIRHTIDGDFSTQFLDCPTSVTELRIRAHKENIEEYRPNV
jgi:hypothetical protein